MRSRAINTSDDYKLAIPYQDFDVFVNDINEEQLTELGRKNGIEHLSPATFAPSPFPISGVIHNMNIRFMVPLVCQETRNPNSKTLVVWFLVDTCSPYTCLTRKSLEAMLGEGKADENLYYFSIQDKNSIIECRLSKGNFEFANILGADALQHLRLSTIVDWRNESFQLVEQ